MLNPAYSCRFSPGGVWAEARGGVRRGRAITPRSKEARIAAFVFAGRIRPVDWFARLIIQFFLSRCFGLLSGIRAWIVICSLVPTTEPWRGYKVCETIRRRWPRNCGRGNELILAKADVAFLNQKRITSAKRRRWTIELRLAAPARNPVVAPFHPSSRHDTISSRRPG